MTRDLLTAQDITVRYGRATALDDVRITAPAGRVTGIVGPNGAGKSSLLLAIYGSVPADGRIVFGGNDLSRKRALERARAGIALVPQGRQLFPKMSVRENLQIMAELLKCGRDAVDEAMDRFPILRDRSALLAGVLSGGEQQMLVVARALMGEPSVLLLDEVMTGLAPKIVEQLGVVFDQLRADGVAIVVADPSVNVMDRLADSAYVLVRGHVVDHETGDGIRNAYQSAMGVENAV